MKKDQIIKDIIFLPKRFSKGDASLYSLLKESGYFEVHNQISEADIFEKLIQNLECIDLWLRLSSDKRSNSGWYFKQNDSNMYIVGYFPPSDNYKTIEYLDRIEACSTFIKREIENIRNS